MPQSWPNHYSH